MKCYTTLDRFKPFPAILLILFAFSSSFAQSNKEADAGKDKKKEQQEAERASKARKIEAMLNNKRFVVEADFVGGRNGDRIPVSSNLNFFMLDSSRVYFQLGSTGGGPGLNGVGGATIEGQLTKYNFTVHQGKKSTTFYIKVNMLSSFGSFDVFLTAYNSGKIDATIGDNMGNKIKYYGNMVAPAESRIYRGVISR